MNASSVGCTQPHPMREARPISRMAMRRDGYGASAESWRTAPTYRAAETGPRRRSEANRSLHSRARLPAARKAEQADGGAQDRGRRRLGDGVEADLVHVDDQVLRVGEEIDTGLVNHVHVCQPGEGKCELLEPAVDDDVSA